MNTNTCSNTRTDPAEVGFQVFLKKLLFNPESGWGAKRQLEFEMARRVSGAMREVAERLRDENTHLEHCLVLLKYSKVLDFMLRSLSAGREIDPQTLRTLFELAGLPMPEAYPG